MFSFRNISIAKQLSAFYVCVFLIPMLAVGSFLYLSTQQTLSRNNAELDYFATLNAGRVARIIGSETFKPGVAKQTDEIMQELKTLQINFEQLSKTGQLRFFAVDTSGTIHFLFPSRFTQGANFRRQTNMTVLVRSLLDTNRQVFFAREDDRGQRVFVSARYLVDKKFGFILQKNQSEILSSFVSLRDIYLASVGVIGILLVLLVLYAKQFITNPLENITEVAKRIEEGDYQQSVLLFGRNEIGILAHAFQKMSRELISINAHLDEKVKEKTARLHHALEIVHAQKAQDDALLSSISEGMIATDQDGRVLLANKAAEQLFEFRLKEVIGKPIFTIVLLQTREKIFTIESDHPAIRALATQKKIRTSDLFAKRGENFFPIEISVAPILLKEKLFGSILILTDITKEKEIDRMKTEFIGIASHQLRGPLASLKWYGDWFIKGKVGRLTKAQKECADKMNHSTLQMISLVDDFLNVSRIEQGMMKNTPEFVDVVELARNIFALAKHETDEKQLRIDIHSHLQPQQILSTDPDILREILTNYISNAIKYSKENGMIRVEITTDATECTFEVHNTGEGIPLLDQPKIFSKFFRASNMVKQGIHGSGLGLYTVKQLTELIGGTVGFTSQEGQETIFWVKLPLKPL